MTAVVLVRHGETGWNAGGRLTGWSDPPLSDRGRHQASRAGAGLAARSVRVDRVYTSMLGRASETASIMLAAAGGTAVAPEADWRLNERHLGRLQGLTRAEVTAAWGDDWRRRWRDDDRCRPPALATADPDHPRHDPRYRHVPADRLPGSERGCDTARRVLAFWHERVVPDVTAHRTVLVVSHLGPLRVLGRHLGLGATDGPAPGPWPWPWPNAVPWVLQVPVPPCCPATAPARA